MLQHYRIIMTLLSTVLNSASLIDYLYKNKSETIMSVHNTLVTNSKLSLEYFHHTL